MKLAHILLALLFLPAIARAQSSDPLTNGLVVFYTLNGTTDDALGNGNSGTLENGAYFTNGLCDQPNSAVYLDGVYAYVAYGKNDAVYPNQILTWSAWFNSSATNGTIFWDDDWQLDGDRNLGLANGKLAVNVEYQGLIVGTNDVTLDTWHQATFTSDTNGQALYLDGELIASTNVVIPDHAGRSWVALGAATFDDNNGPNYVYLPYPRFQGLMTLMRIYDRALSATEARQLYQSDSAPTTVTSQPVDVTTPVNGNATFSVAAAGTPPLAYQWRFNGTTIAGANSAAFSIPNAQPADAGGYSVVVSDGCGSVTSSVATLTVLYSPVIISGPASVVTSPGKPVTFSVQASGQPAPTYHWLFNGSSIPGATGTSYTIASASLTNIGLYSVVVANSQGLDISGTASLGFFDIQLPTTGSPAIYLNAPIGASYRIEAATQLPPANWTTLTNVTVNSQPFILTGFAPVTNAAGFYRAMPQ